MPSGNGEHDDQECYGQGGSGLLQCYTLEDLG